MTDRYNALIVVLDHDIRDDDAEATIQAIQQIRGVLKVTPHKANIDEAVAESRVRSELIEKLFKILKEK